MVALKQNESLIKQLAKIQQSLKAPKSAYNSFGKYNYRSCEDILEGVKPLLDNLVLSLSDEVIQVGERIYVKTTATISNGVDQFKVSAWAREPLVQKGMNDAQITGSASSYARKYALNGLFCIDDTKDADTVDNTDGKKTETKKPVDKKVKLLLASQVDILQALCDNVTDGENRILSYIGQTNKVKTPYFSLKELLEKDFILAKTTLEKQI